MIFELSHDNLKDALQEYMASRDILKDKDFTFQVKTSRKGLKTSRTIIEVMHTKPSVKDPEPDTSPVMHLSEPVEEEDVQMELPLEPMLQVVRTKPFMNLVA